MYDIIIIKCRGCGKIINSQTKILWKNNMEVLKIGDEILNNDLANCILKIKDNCGCGCENAIVIKKGKIVGVENSKYANVVERRWRDYEWCDELEQIVKEKIWRISSEKIRTNKK